MSFAKKLVLNLPKKQLVFNPKRGKVYNKRTGSRLNISIKDPFIKELNHGVEMMGNENLKQLYTTLFHFMKAAARGNVGEFLLEENFVDNATSRSGEDSHNLTQSKSSPNTDGNDHGSAKAKISKKKRSDDKSDTQRLDEERKEPTSDMKTRTLSLDE